MSPEEQWQHMWELQQLPRTPGTTGGMKTPMTPRTRAFQSLGGSMGGGQPPVPASYYQYQSVQTVDQTPQLGAGAHYESPYQTPQTGPGESPYRTNDEYYGSQELVQGEWVGKGKGAAY
jgi:hypothetical protein